MKICYNFAQLKQIKENEAFVYVDSVKKSDQYVYCFKYGIINYIWHVFSIKTTRLSKINMETKFFGKIRYYCD